MAFDHLSGLLKKSARKRGIAMQVEAAMVLEFFAQEVRVLLGDEVSRSIKPMYVRDNTITVAVPVPTLAQELKLIEKKVIDNINKKAGSQVVNSLRFLS